MQKLIEVDFSSQGDNGKILVTGAEIPFSMSGDISATQIEHPDFYQRVVDEGFDLTGSPESQATNWGIVNAWTDEQLADFLTFAISKASRVNNLEIVDRIFMGNVLNN